MANLFRHLPRIPLPHKPRFLHGIPPNAVLVIAVLLAVNLAVWAVVGVAVLRTRPALVPPAALSYTLGLRHALDADHIAAIDLVTRRLLASDRYSSPRPTPMPATVGTFFSLGHSTVVVVTCVVVAATSGALRDRFDGFARVGNVVGTAVSAAFLILLCGLNGWILCRLVRRLRRVLAQRRLRRRDVGQHRQQQELSAGEEEEGGEEDGLAPPSAPKTAATTTTTTATTADHTGHLSFFHSGSKNAPVGGIMTRVLGFLFKAIDRPWKMYPLGVVFGLGFDTSSEIAILGIASVHAVQGTSIWLILIFPILFTSGMCLLDTTDGALMMALYSSRAFSRDPVAILYYSVVLTAITVLVAAFIGIVQLLSLVQNVAEPDGRFWDGVADIGDHFDIVGGCIVATFVLAGIASVIVYRPWRRRMERDRQARVESAADAGMRGDTDGLNHSSPSSHDEAAQPRQL